MHHDANHLSSRGLELPPTELLIDGRWEASATGLRFDSIDPATGQVITRNGWRDVGLGDGHGKGGCHRGLLARGRLRGLRE